MDLIKTWKKLRLNCSSSLFSPQACQDKAGYLSFSISIEVLIIGFPAEKQTFLVDPILLFVSVRHRDSLATGPLDAGGQEDGPSVRLISVSSWHIWDCPDPSVSPCTWSCSISLDPQGPSSKAIPDSFGWHLFLLLFHINCTTQLGIICKLLRVHSILLSRPPIKMLKSIHTRKRSLRITFVTALHLDMEPLITNFWPQPSSQFLIYHIVHLLYPYFSNLETYLESIYFLKVFLITNNISCTYNITGRKNKIEYLSVFIYKAFFGLAEKIKITLAMLSRLTYFKPRA